jgi:hypothetical protein
MAATLVAALLLAAVGPLSAQPAARSPFEPPPVPSPPLPGLEPAAVRPRAPAAPAPRKAAPPPPQKAPRQLAPNELLAPAGMTFAKPRSPRRRAAVVTTTAGATENGDERHGWRRTLLYGSLVATALGAAVGGAALYVAEEKAAEFNRYRVNAGDDAPPEARRCGSRLPGRGAPGCAELLADRDRARRYGIVALGAAGAFALTAIALLATAPDSSSSSSSGEARARAGQRRQLAWSCAPGVGLQAACGLRF